MSPCHHIHRGLNNTYECCVSTMNTVPIMETVPTMEAMATMVTVPTMETVLTIVTVPTMQKQCCMQKQHRTNILNEVVNVIIFF